MNNEWSTVVRFTIRELIKLRSGSMDTIPVSSQCSPFSLAPCGSPVWFIWITTRNWGSPLAGAHRFVKALVGKMSQWIILLFPYYHAVKNWIITNQSFSPLFRGTYCSCWVTNLEESTMQATPIRLAKNILAFLLMQEFQPCVQECQNLQGCWYTGKKPAFPWRYFSWKAATQAVFLLKPGYNPRMISNVYAAWKTCDLMSDINKSGCNKATCWDWYTELRAMKKTPVVTKLPIGFKTGSLRPSLKKHDSSKGGKPSSQTSRW